MQTFICHPKSFAGNGRMDSPGFRAEYCIYTLMDTKFKDILCMGVINKRGTGLNSVTMVEDECQHGERHQSYRAGQ